MNTLYLVGEMGIVKVKFTLQQILGKDNLRGVNEYHTLTLLKCKSNLTPHLNVDECIFENLRVEFLALDLQGVRSTLKIISTLILKKGGVN